MSEISNLQIDSNCNHRTSDTVESASKFPYHKHIVTTQGYDLSISGTEEKLKELARLKAEKKEIEDFVLNIPDIKLRRIFKLYINGHTHQYIASKLGYRDEGTIRKKIKKFL